MGAQGQPHSNSATGHSVEASSIPSSPVAKDRLSFDTVEKAGDQDTAELGS